ncbi:hypothetical protein K6W19_33610, partial [Pseudomonas protegens]|nr:hypothetical protein [Pseudomonas protegens]
IISIVGGYLFGSLFFMLINKITTGHQTSLRAYPFDVKAMWITLLLLFIAMLLLFMINQFKITLQNPMQLINKKAHHK